MSVEEKVKIVGKEEQKKNDNGEDRKENDLLIPSSSNMNSSLNLNSNSSPFLENNRNNNKNNNDSNGNSSFPASITTSSCVDGASASVTPNDNGNENDFESLEYEEDVYYRDVAATPSFDDIDELSDSDEIVVHCWRGSSGDIEEIVVDDSMYCLSVETDFCDYNKLSEEEDREKIKSGNLTTSTKDTAGNGIDNRIFKSSNGFSFSNGTTKKKKRSVRVIFQDLSKPYLAKISSSQNYKKFLEIVKGEEASPHSVGDPLSPTEDFLAERELRREEWTAELAKVEEEIQTLRHVLASKVKVSQELKRKLGIGAWKELTDDVNQGLRNVKESQVFQKTESVIKTTAEKTTSILGGFSSGITMKLGQMRNSESFRSLEERVGSAYENVKTKVVPSRSNSTQSFDEALREAEATRRASAAPSATSPTIPEEKLIHS